MLHICTTHIDSYTGVPCTVAPMATGPKFPEVKGLSIFFGNESQWPTNTPLFYGTCDDDADLTLPGVLRALSVDEFLDVLKQEVSAATQRRLDDFARTRNYDGILSLCTYATSTVPKFKAEGQYGVEARDATWAKLYAVLAEVEGGTRPMPSGYADIEPKLPALAWPA